ncbi:MAG: spore coat protein [Clostridia bacterium]|nr:spore coat protein [Clostridia bacterium]
MPNTPCLSDKDLLKEFLDAQKQETQAYNYFAGECKNDALRASCLQILDEEHDIQNAIFNIMHANGWYPTKPAAQADIDATRQMFNIT